MNARLLLVDDEAGFVETLAQRLRSRDYLVSIALSGKEALQCLERDPHLDVVILDVKMPGMDGIETLKHIKSQWPLVEVLMLTGHATVDSAIEGMRLGAYDYLMKPCDIEILLAKINEATSKKRAHEERIAAARAQEIALRRGD